MIKNPMYRNGNKCTVICTYKPGPQPIVTHNSDGNIITHHENGRQFYDDNESAWDLVETPPKVTYGHIDIDAEVIVTGKNIEPYPAHFAGVNYLGDPLIYKEGRTSHTALGCNKTNRVWKVEVVS